MVSSVVRTTELLECCIDARLQLSLVRAPSEGIAEVGHVPLPARRVNVRRQLLERGRNVHVRVGPACVPMLVRDRQPPFVEELLRLGAIGVRRLDVDGAGANTSSVFHRFTYSFVGSPPGRLRPV
jgi:hypothetical protein